MKVLHIAEKHILQKSFISGIKTVLTEQLKLEKKIVGIESVIYNDDKEKILKYDPDIVIFHGFWNLEHIKLAFFLSRNNIVYYIKPHGSFDVLAMKNGILKYIKKIIAKKLIFNRYVKGAHGIIFLNEEESLKSVYKKNFIIQSNIIEKKEKITKRINSTDKIIITYLGRIDMYHKGLDILLDTLLNNQDFFKNEKIFFQFYGVGKKNEIKKIKNYEEKLISIMKFYGKIEGEEKNKMLAESDIFIHTSRFEGQPMAIIEALNQGVPCLVSKGTNMSNIIEKYESGWIYSENKKLFSTILKAINAYRGNELKYRLNAEKCSEIFTYNKLEKKYYDGYKKIRNCKNGI